MRIRATVLVGVACAFGAALPVRAAHRFTLAQHGEPETTIVLGMQPCAASTNMAVTLSDILTGISGAAFAIATGDGSTGIAVGMASEFPGLADDPALRLRERFAPTDLATRQGYVLRSHEKGAQLIGASELGVVYAGWDFLYRLGYRQFFPREEWEVIPTRSDLSIAVGVFEKPDYILRHIAGSVTPEWCVRNRTSPVLGWQHASALPYLPRRWTSSLAQNQHNWGAIVAHSKEEFDAHPEYLGLVTVKEGEATRQERRSSKLCVSNPRVRELAATYAFDYFRENPEQPSVSMEPTDGSGWCECLECAKVGAPSERVALLANHVARALEEEFPEKYVGVLAYHLHADPPARKLHPRVVVSLATALSGKTPLEQRLADWAGVCQNLGVYEYLSVMEWHLGLPAKSLVANLPELTKRIPDYHQKNVRFFTGQATGGAWGGHGLGYYVLSRLLWDVGEAERVQAIVDDFLHKAFGEAAEPMREYYRVIDGSQQKPGTGAFFLERASLMYDALRAAKKATTDPAVHNRLNQLVLYTRYVQLFGHEAEARGTERHYPALVRFVRFAYRIRDKGVVGGYGMARAYVKGASSVPLRADPPSAVSGLALEEPGPAYIDRPIDEADIRAILDGTSVIPAGDVQAPGVPQGDEPGTGKP